jgi:hypothetical protein
VDLPPLLKGHPPRIRHGRALDRLARRSYRIVVPVVADELDDLHDTEGSLQPPKGRELVIVDLGHLTIMPPWPEHRAAARAGVAGQPCCSLGRAAGFS